MKIWYVYKITFATGRFYIGYRGTTRAIEQDLLVKYFSSSKLVKRLLEQGTACVGEVLATFDQQREAYEFEQQSIFDQFDNPLILNQSCYFGREGFGILSEASRAKISQRSKQLWEDPAYRACMVEKRKTAWTDERKNHQSDRLTGQRRPHHSAIMKSRPVNQSFAEHARSKRTVEHKQSISRALTGRRKTDEHIQKLRKPKPRTVCRIYDKRLMTLGNFMVWYNRQVSPPCGNEIIV